MIPVRKSPLYPNEEWRQVKSNNHYFISNHKRVYSLYTGKVLQAYPDKRGRLTVTLYSDKQPFVLLVDDVYEETFLD